MLSIHGGRYRTCCTVDILSTTVRQNGRERDKTGDSATEFLVRLVALSWARERQCDKTGERARQGEKTDAIATLKFCRSLARFVVLLPVLSHCRERDSDSVKCPISATIIFSFELKQSSFRS